MGGQPGKPKPIGNPPIRYEPQRPPIEEPPKPIPPPPVERPPLPVAVLISMAWTARPIATPAADNSAIAPQIKQYGEPERCERLPIAGARRSASGVQGPSI
jgi:hypothetical protein